MQRCIATNTPAVNENMRQRMKRADTLAFMHQKPSHLTGAQSDRVVRALRRRLHQEHQGNVSALAREIGISQPVLSRTLNERHGATMATTEAIARAEGVPVASILYGPRERAIEICREAGIPEVALERVEAEPEPDEFHTTMWWIERIKAVATLGSGSGELDTRAAPRRLG